MPIVPAGFGALDVVVGKPVIPCWDKATITPLGRCDQLQAGTRDDGAGLTVAGDHPQAVGPLLGYQRVV